MSGVNNGDKRHYIVDETLGGVEREYVEVDGKASVGDYVVVTDIEGYSGDEFYDVGHIGMVYKLSSADSLLVDFNGYGNSFVDADGRWFIGGYAEGSYAKLSPTNIVRIGGKRYELADREAKVGEKVIVVKARGTYDKYDNGAVFSVDKYCGLDGIVVDSVRTPNEYENPDGFIADAEYNVLIPLEDEAPTEDITDLLANLSLEVAKLKRKVSELESQADTNAKDIRTWAEDFTETKAELTDKVEMLTDDIVTLDERTNPNKVEYKSKLAQFRGEGGCV